MCYSRGAIASLVPLVKVHDCILLGAFCFECQPSHDSAFHFVSRAQHDLAYVQTCLHASAIDALIYVNSCAGFTAVPIGGHCAGR